MAELSATDTLGGIDVISNHGLPVDLYLPGRDITTATWDTSIQGESFAEATGTSFAAPMASGAIAMMMSLCPPIIASDIAFHMINHGGNLEGVMTEAWYACNSDPPPPVDDDLPESDPNEPPECAECDCAETCPHEGCLFSASQLACDKGGTPGGCSAAGSSRSGFAAVLLILLLAARSRLRRRLLA